MPQDILITPTSGEPQILFRGSGTTDTAIELNVLSSYQSATGSGTALVFEGTQGQLFAVTDNLSSGTIFSVGDITGLPLFEIDASGRLYLSRYGSTIDAFNTLQMRPSGTAAGDTSPIRFYELAANGSNYVGLKAPNSINSNLVWTLPSGDGTNNQVLKTDGAGNLGWASAAIGSFVDGVGTSGYVARWIDADTIGTGVVYDNGTNVGIGTTSPTAKLHIETGSAANSGVLIRGTAGQTADLLQIQNSAGTTLLDIDAAGSLSGVGSGVFMQRVGVGTAFPTATLQVNHSSVSGLAIIGSHDRNLYIQNDGSSTGILLQHQGQNRFEVFTTGTVFINKSSTNALKSLAFYDPIPNLYEYNGFGSSSGAVSALRYNVVNSNFDHIFFRGDSGATSTELMRIRGNRTVGINTAAPAAMLHVTPTGTTATGIIVRGVASQTADLQQWQDSAGTALARIGFDGSISGVGSGIFMQRVGVGTSNPTQALHVAGNARLTGALFDSLNVPGNSGQFLVSTSGGIEWRTGGGGGVTGTGAANKLAFFDSTTNITSDTNLHWDNTNKRLGVGQVSPVTVLDVLRSGIITTSQTGVRIINNSTSSTNSISKEGLFVASSGTFSGSSTTNRGLSVHSYNGATVEGINILAQTAASTLYGIQSVLTINSTETNIYGYHTTVSNSLNTQNKTYYGYNFQMSDDETTAGIVNSFGVRTYQDFTDNTSAGSKHGIYSYIKTSSSIVNQTYGSYTEINHQGGTSYGCYIAGFGGSRINYGVYTTGTSNSYFDSRVGINQVSPTAMLQVQPTGATVTGVIVRGAVGQTADLLQIQTSVSNPIFKVASNGSVLVDLSPAAVTTATGIIVRGAANQTADLQEWQNSAGAVLAQIDAAGSISGVASGIFMSRVGVNNSSPRSMLHINTTNAATSGIIVNASATQTAPLSAWQDSNNNNITTINADGTISTSGITADYYRTSANMIFTETGTVRTLTTNDNGRVIMCTNNSPVTINIGTAVGTAGFSATFIQAGSGQLTLNASGTTMNNRQSHTKTAGLWAVVSLMCRTTNNFVLAGDTGA